MKFEPSLTLKNDCYRMTNANATTENSVSTEGNYAQCRRDAQCKCEMCMESMQATMDLRSPNNTCSSNTDLSGSPHPHRRKSSRRSKRSRRGKGSPKTEMSENKSRKENGRVSSMTVGSTSKSEPDLSGHANDDGPLITESKKNILLGDATDDGSILPERRKPWNFSGQVAGPRKEMGLDAADDGSRTSEVKWKDTSFGDAADDGSMIADIKWKDTLFGDAADDGLQTAETEMQNSWVYKSTQELPMQKILSDGATEEPSIITERKNTFGGTTDHASMLADLQRKIAAEVEIKMSAETERVRKLLHLNGIEELERQGKILLGDSTEDGSIEAEVERKRRILFSDAADDRSTRPEIDRKNTLFGDAADGGSLAEEMERKLAAEMEMKIAEIERNWTNWTNSFGCAADDESIVTDRRKNALFGDATDYMSSAAEIEMNNNTSFGDLADEENLAEETLRKQKLLYLSVVEELKSRQEIIRGEPTEDGSFEGEIERNNLLDDAADGKRENSLFGDATDDESVIAEREKKNILFGEATDDGSIIAVRKSTTWVGDAADDESMTAKIERNKSLVGDAADDELVRARIERMNNSLLGDAADDGSIKARIERTNKNLLGDATEIDVKIAGMELKMADIERNWRNCMNLFGRATDDGSTITDGRKNALFGDAIDCLSSAAEIETKNNLFGDVADDGKLAAETLTKQKLLYFNVIEELEEQQQIARGEPTEDGALEAERKDFLGDAADGKRENTILFGDATDDGSVIAEREKNILFGDATDDGSIKALRKNTALVEDAADDELITTKIERNKSLVGDAADDGSMTQKIEWRKERLFGDAADDRSIRARIEKTNKNFLGDAADDGSITVETEWRKESLLGDAADDRSMTAIIERRNKRLLGDAADDGSITGEIERENEILFADAADDRSITAQIERENSSFVDAVDAQSIITVGGKKLWFADSGDDGSTTAESRKGENILFGDTIDDERRKRKKEEGRTKWGKLGIILFILLVEFILPWCLSGLFGLSLTADRLKDISEESMVRRRLSDRLDFVAQKLSRIVPGQVMNCAGSDSAWKLQQDGLLVYSHCTLYSSMVEEVSIWGFPSQTAGVISRGITDRSFTILSGRMIEWYEGKTDYAVHQEGDSWTHELLAASVVQMDGKTWILEYRPAAILRGGGLVSWALRFLKWRTDRICERVRLNYRSFLLPMLSVRRIHGDLRTLS